MDFMWIFQFLLRFYPPEHQAIFRPEMLKLLEEKAYEQCRCSWNVHIYFVLRESWGLLAGAAAEWKAKLTHGDYLADQRLPDQMERKLALPADMVKAQELVKSALRCMEHAIANHQFKKARFYSHAEVKARERLRLLQRKYNIVE